MACGRAGDTDSDARYHQATPGVLPGHSPGPRWERACPTQHAVVAGESSARDDPGRAYKPVRRKRQDWRYPVSPGIGVRMDGLHLGGGIIAGQNLGFILNELTRDAALVEDFDELAIPFRAVATDLETGEEVVIGSGNLS